MFQSSHDGIKNAAFQKGVRHFLLQTTVSLPHHAGKKGRRHLKSVAQYLVRE